jgi:hypothetical protein
VHKSKNKRENDYGNDRETNTHSHSFERNNHADPQIALGGIGRESGAATKGAGAERDHR